MTVELIHRGYAFVCLSCGHGWEAEYDICRHIDRHNHVHADYYAAGRKVPSPLTHAECPACERRHVRILRPGRVESARPHHD